MTAHSEVLEAQKKELDLVTDFAPMLAAGYAVHLWNTAGSVRVAEILRPTDRMGTSAPKLGYGADATAAEALLRARNSYIEREAAGKAELSREDIGKADAGYITGDYPDGSYLDAVASSSEISFYMRSGEVVAEMPSLTFGEGRRAFAVGATIVDALAQLELVSGGRKF